MLVLRAPDHSMLKGNLSTLFWGERSVGGGRKPQKSKAKGRIGLQEVSVLNGVPDVVRLLASQV